MLDSDSGLGGWRILLAEDNKINQQFATLVLEKAGHQVVVAGNGQLAVDALRVADFDAVLMDIQMPEMDGVQATQQIRAMTEPQKKTIPIIAVTAHALAGAREEYLASGMDGYISKPFAPALLLSTLAQAVQRAAPPSPAAALDIRQADAIPAEQLAVLDLVQLNTFGSVFSKQKLKTLASLYLIDIEARLNLIVQSRARDDFEGVSRQAHMIVSTAGNLGAKQTSALARMLETTCLARDYAQCDARIAALFDSCKTSSIALRAWQDEQPGAAATG